MKFTVFNMKNVLGAVINYGVIFTITYVGASSIIRGNDSLEAGAYGIPLAMISSSQSQSFEDEVSVLASRLQKAYGVDKRRSLNFAGWILEAEAYNPKIPADVIASMIMTESSFKYSATSKAGAIGPAQVKPQYWASLCGNLNNPRSNILCGAQVLSRYRAQAGSLKAAIKMYNVGPSNYNNNKMKVATDRYVGKIAKHLAMLDNSGVVIR